MAISRKTFNTVKDILKELDQKRSATRRDGSGTSAEAHPTTRATPKHGGGSNGLASPGSSDRPGVSDQLIG